jgi:hypothetical protein
MDVEDGSRAELSVLLASRVAHGSRVGRPEYHHAMLMTALDAYADQLATRIDAG